MTPPPINEDETEQAALSLLRDLGYSILFGPEVSPQTLYAERKSYSDVILTNRLRNAIADLDPTTQRPPQKTIRVHPSNPRHPRAESRPSTNNNSRT